jgi:uncharacterized protein (UPF0335 family)
MTETNGGAAGDRIRHFIDRVWRLEEEKAEETKSYSEDIKQVYAEAAAEGFNAQALKEVISLKKKARKRGQSFVDDFDLYRHAAGLEGTPLDMARERREREQAEKETDADFVVMDPEPEPQRPTTVAVTGKRAKMLDAPPKRIAGPKPH